METFVGQIWLYVKCNEKPMEGSDLYFKKICLCGSGGGGGMEDGGRSGVSKQRLLRQYR